MLPVKYQDSKANVRWITWTQKQKMCDILGKYSTRVELRLGKCDSMTDIVIIQCSEFYDRSCGVIFSLEVSNYSVSE